MEKKLDCLVIASEYSGAREIFDLLRLNFESTPIPGFYGNKAIQFKSGNKDLRLGILEPGNIEELHDQNISGYLNPEGKIYLILRNPVWRSYAAYKQNYKEGKESYSFFDAIKWESNPEEIRLGASNTNYIFSSKYFKGIKNLLDNSGIKKLSILLYEDMKHYPFEILLNFKDNLFLEFNTSTEIIAHNLGKKQIARKRIGILKYISDNPIKLKEETAKYIYYTYFKKDIDELEQLLNINLSSWKFTEKAPDGMYAAVF